MDQSTLQATLENQEIHDLERLAKQTVQHNPDQAYGYYYLAEASWQLQKYQNAEICMAKAIELDDQNVSYLLRLATYKQNQGHNDDARLLYSKALDLDPDNPQVLLGLASYAINEAADYEKGLEYLDRALEQDTNDELIHLLRAKALQELEHPEEALEAAQNALKLAQSEEAWMLKINAEIELEDDDAVHESYEQLIRLAPEKLSYRTSFGNYLLDEGESEAAETQFRKVLELDERYNAPVTGLLGMSLMEQEKYQEAVRVFEEMEAQVPDDEEIYIQRANARLALDDTKGALADLKKGLNYVSDANKVRLYLKEAEIYTDQANWEAAQKCYKRLTDDDLYAPDGYFGLGKVLHQMGKHKAALEALQEAHKRRHRAARTYILKHLEAQLKTQEQENLSQYQDYFAKNAACESLSPYFGLYGNFDPYQNKVSKNLPEDIAKKLMEQVKDTGFVITEQGIMVISPIEKHPLKAAYRVLTVDDNDVEIELMPLDSTPSYEAILTIEGQTLRFSPQLRKAKEVVFQMNKPEKLSTKQKVTIRNYVSKTDLNFLGDKANTLQKALFG